MDAEILDLRYLYEREKMREIDLGKTTLLMSRAFRNRIDVLVRARNRLAEVVKTKPTQKRTYQIVLNQKKDDLDDAVLNLEQIDRELKNIATAMLVAPTDEQLQYRFKELSHNLTAQKRRVSAKERAYVDWCKKSEFVPNAITRLKMPADYNPETDAQEIVRTDLTVEDILGRNENWNTSMKDAVNKTSIDMISNPTSESSISTNTLEYDVMKIANPMFDDSGIMGIDRKKVMIDFDAENKQEEKGEIE